jgi:hypothetical protein
MGIDFDTFYDFDIWRWNWSDSEVFFFFIFIRNVHSAKKETHKGILGILIQTFSVILLDIDSECLLLQN